MPCTDFASVRPEKSVPPKKFHSWRSHSITSPEQQQTPNSVSHYKDSTPDSGVNLPTNMGSNTRQSDSQNDNGRKFQQISSPKNLPEDMPLDFSMKPVSKHCLPRDTATPSRNGQPGELNPNGYPFGISNGEMNGGPLSHAYNKIDPRFSTNTPKHVRDPAETTTSSKRELHFGCFDMNNSEEPADFDARASARQRISSTSPCLHSPSSSSKSPILANMLNGNSPNMLPVMPMDVYNSRMISLGFQNGYPNGLNPVCVSGGIQSSTPVLPNPTMFPPGNILTSPGIAFLQPQVNMLPPVSALPLQNKVEVKTPRKSKQERPFKNYDVSLQDDVQCNPWQVNLPPVRSQPCDESSPPGGGYSGPRDDPNPNENVIMNGNSDNSSTNSEPPSAASEMDNVPHSSVPGNSPNDETTASGRKRKPVADSQKDANYWERRKKNNQAAKRSRENRRIKEDTVAQQALYFRSETSRLSQLILHLNARIHDISMKCANLEQDKLSLTAENAMIKQIVSQKRCGQCGNQL